MCCSKREETDERRTRKRTSAGRDRGDTTVVEDVCAERIGARSLRYCEIKAGNQFLLCFVLFSRARKGLLIGARSGSTYCRVMFFFLLECAFSPRAGPD